MSASRRTSATSPGRADQSLRIVDIIYNRYSWKVGVVLGEFLELNRRQRVS